MKTLTISLILISGGLALCSLGSCKKLADQKPANTSPKVAINPVTTNITDNFSFSDTTLINHGWTKTFEDNFDGDLSKWGMLHGGFTGDVQCYQPENISLSGGVLQIAAKKETVTGPVVADSQDTKTFNFTSGWMISKSTISACTGTPRIRIVARMKVASGYGLISMLNTFGNDFPVNGEIICTETANNNPARYGTDYAYGTTSNQNMVANGFQYNPVSGDLSAAYHVYTVEWTKNALTYYIDGNLVETKTVGGHVPDLFSKVHNISLSAPVGRQSIGNLDLTKLQGGTMYVDYVKVFVVKAL